MGNESVVVQTDKAKPGEDENLAGAAKMKKKLRTVQFAKQMVDEEVRLLTSEIEMVSTYLKMYCHIKYDFLNVIQSRRLKARKVVSRSLAVAASSLAFGLRCNRNNVLKDALPWTLGVGAVSIAFSLIYLKDFLQSFKTPDILKWKKMEAVVSDIPKPPGPPEYHIESMNLSLDRSFPEELFAVCLSSKEIGARQRRRLMSAGL